MYTYTSIYIYIQQQHNNITNILLHRTNNNIHIHIQMQAQEQQITKKMDDSNPCKQQNGSQTQIQEHECNSSQKISQSNKQQSKGMNYNVKISTSTCLNHICHGIQNNSNSRIYGQSYRKLRAIKSQKIIPVHQIDQTIIQQQPMHNNNQEAGGKNSSKRYREDMKKMLTQGQIKQQKQISQKFVQLRVLTKEKDDLMKQLNMLKQAAVQALKQKQLIIQKLKNSSKNTQNTQDVDSITNNEKHYQLFKDDDDLNEKYLNKYQQNNKVISYYKDRQDQIQQMQAQISQYHIITKHLQEEVKEISDKCAKQRTFFFQQLCSRQSIIEQLNNRISVMSLQLQKSQQQNKQIRQQFEDSLREVGEKFQNVQHQIEQQKINYQNIIKNNKYENQLQIQNIRRYYENQINIIKNMCERQINDNIGLKKTLQTQALSDHQQNQSVYQLLSLKSGLNYKNQCSDSGIRFKSQELRSQLKDMRKQSDQDKSQFTNNYFSYDNSHAIKSLTQKQSIESSKNININQVCIENQFAVQTENSFQKQIQISGNHDKQGHDEHKNEKKFNKSYQNLSKRQMLYFLGGGTIGSLTTLFLYKIISKTLG